MGLVASASSGKAADPSLSDLSLPVTGEVLGTVLDPAGTPQMGAVVQLFNKYQRIVSRASTDSQGRFAFAGLNAESYSLRVSLASFLPASRDQVMVKAGFDSVLEIHLATLLSDVQVNYRVPTGAMSEDWKWVLRSSPATRLVTRMLPVDFPQGEPVMRPRVFSETHAILSVSGGDGALTGSDEIGADLGTSFALSTNLFGKNQVQLAGAYGQNTDIGPPAISLCAIYSRADESPFTSPPEVTFALTQLSGVGSQLTNPAAGNQNLAGLNSLRSMSLSFYEVADPFDNVHLEYGVQGESVEFVQHVSRISPFARVTVDGGSLGSLVASYTDGGRPSELTAHQQFQDVTPDGQGDELSSPLDSLSRLPQISERNGRLRLQSTEAYELGYKKVAGSRTYSVSGFYENVWNGRLNVAGDRSQLNSGDLFSDGISATSSYNIGRYNRTGYLASVDQRVNDSLDLALAYGRLGGFAADPTGFSRGSPSSSGRFLAERERNLATVSARTRLPRVGTRVSASYGWVDPRTVMPRHVFTTQNVVSTPGLNIVLHQPLPSLFGIPGRLELTADLRNLLAEGYTPINTGDGRQLLVVEAPRAIRGGLKFTF